MICFKSNVLFVAFSVLLFTSCETSEKDTVFTTEGRKVKFSPDDRRGNFMEIGEVGTEGIDMYGYISNSYGGLSGTALIICDRAGKYGYQVVKEPNGLCRLNMAELQTYDTMSYWVSGEIISQLSKNEIFYDEVTEAGTHRIIYFSQGSITDYEYEIRVRYMEE